ncbi:MAG: proton-conducting transporter membrane subunit [Cyanophyceae cyanobacterium]
MAAPTPISALVHRSTLVAAGIFLFIENISFLSIKIIIFIIFIISLFTLFIRGINSFFEIDIKKIIALSTLNQLRLIFLRVCFFLKFVAFFHLISHALFKSLLFFNAGVFIHL